MRGRALSRALGIIISLWWKILSTLFGIFFPLWNVLSGRLAVFLERIFRSGIVFLFHPSWRSRNKQAVWPLLRLGNQPMVLEF
jgi:hypothetical protein